MDGVVLQRIPGIVVFDHFNGCMAGRVDDADKVLFVVQGKLYECFPERMRGDFFARNHLKGDFFDHFENVLRPDRLVEFVRPVVPHRVENIRANVPVLPFEFVEQQCHADRQGQELKSPSNK